MTPPTDSRLNPVAHAGILVFCIAVCAGGCLGLYRGVGYLQLYRRAQKWTPQTAWIREVGLHRSGKSSVEVTAQYDYEFGGQRHTCARVGIARFGDNVGDWQRSTYERLRQARSQGRPSSCFVDPGRPEDALLDRSLRPGLLAFHFGLGCVFASWGLYPLAVAWGALRRKGSRPDGLDMSAA